MPTDPATPTDDLGRTVALDAPPRRIVSLVPSLTELVCALGAGSRLVGATRFCSEPAAIVAALPKVGGTKNPAVEAVAALAPDLVLLNSEENRREEFDQLQAAGLPTFVSFPTDVEGAAASVERLGRVLGTVAGARALAAAIRAERDALARRAIASVRVFCPIWRRPWMSFNRRTYADDVLRCGGGENVCAGAEIRYPSVDLAEVAEQGPEMVLLPDEPYPFAARHRATLAGLAHTPALRRGRVFLVDGKALSWYGPRTPAALRYFRHVLGC